MYWHTALHAMRRKSNLKAGEHIHYRTSAQGHHITPIKSGISECIRRTPTERCPRTKHYVWIGIEPKQTFNPAGGYVQAVWETTKRCLGVDVDGGAPNVDEAVEGVISTADGLRSAVSTRASSDGGDGGAVSANVASETSKDVNETHGAEQLVHGARRLDVVAALGGTGVALASGGSASNGEGSNGDNSEDTGEHVDIGDKEGWVEVELMNVVDKSGNFVRWRNWRSNWAIL